MNPAMPRIHRVQRLSSLHLALSQSAIPSTARPSFAVTRRAISSTCVARSKNTEWLRKKLWKGEAPGAADPYTQRPEPEETSNLPDEALEANYEELPEALLGSSIALPPQRTEATAERDVAGLEPTYVPATTIDGLEDIPTLKQWWDQPGNWGEESIFRAFASAEKVVEGAPVEVYLRRAFVEVLALQETGALSEWATKKWREGPRADLDSTLTAEITVQDGVASIKGDAVAIADSITSDVEDAVVERVSVQEAEQLVAGWDASWKQTQLNEQTKFAVCLNLLNAWSDVEYMLTVYMQINKRLYQLTGKLIPDAKLGAAKTINDILVLATKAPKPKSLAEELELTGRLDNLANVSLHSRRITTIDKEVAVGRWKVIEEELVKRGLPSTGSGGLGRNKEMDRLLGKI